MKLHRTTRYNPELFSLIPLVNVLALVFAFLTLGQHFVLSPGLSVSLPVSPFALNAAREARIVNITAGATPQIYFGDQRVTLEELGQRLARDTSPQRTLLVRADRAVPYEVVSNVMNLGLARGFAVTMAATASEARPQ